MGDTVSSGPKSGFNPEEYAQQVSDEFLENSRAAVTAAGLGCASCSNFQPIKISRTVEGMAFDSELEAGICNLPNSGELRTVYVSKPGMPIINGNQRDTKKVEAIVGDFNGVPEDCPELDDVKKAVKSAISNGVNPDSISEISFGVRSDVRGVISQDALGKIV